MSVNDDIVSAVGEEAIWMQLAEEASELSQAACKMARHIHGTNPCGEDVTETRANVIEEYMDVVLCAELLHIPWHDEILWFKRERWRDRLGMSE